MLCQFETSAIFRIIYSYHLEKFKIDILKPNSHNGPESMLR
jgi:hypothetical protein